MLKNGSCDAFITDEVDVKFIPEDKQEEFCDMQIVSIKAPVTNVQIAMPIQQNFLADFSKAMMDTKIDFEFILEKYTSPPLKCELYIQSKGSDNAQVTIEQMLFPICVLTLSIFVGICFKIITVYNVGNLIRKKKISLSKNQSFMRGMI